MITAHMVGLCVHNAIDALRKLAQLLFCRVGEPDNAAHLWRKGHHSDTSRVSASTRPCEDEHARHQTQRFLFHESLRLHTYLIVTIKIVFLNFFPVQFQESTSQPETRSRRDQAVVNHPQTLTHNPDKQLCLAIFNFLIYCSVFGFLASIFSVVVSRLNHTICTRHIIVYTKHVLFW